MACDGRVAVVGGGFGGLAAAIRLQAAGFSTTLWEARDRLGGRAYVYRQDGFTFDAGPTVITAPHCLEELYEVAGKNLADAVELMPVEPFYRLLWRDGAALDYVGDTEGMLAEVRRIAPGDEAGYLAFVEHSGKLFEAGYRDLVATPFLRPSDMARAAPALARLRADRSVYAAVSRFVRSERLRQALSFHSLLIGGHPFETSSIYTLIHYLERKWGVHFPRGGTGALVDALGALYRDLGGEVKLSSPVSRISVRGRGRRARHVLEARGGAVEDYDAVVSNADLVHTYGVLYRDERAAAKVKRRLSRLAWSMSLFVLYFGTDRRYRDDIAHHTVIFGPRYRELLDEIFHGARLPADFSLYLHAPTVSDPELAPPGCDSFYVLAPVPHLGNAPIDWDRAAPAYADAILASLEPVLPDLRRHVVTRRWMTPTCFERDLGAHLGTAFSCAPTLGQSAYFRPHNRDARIPGLYLVGAGTHPGAGVPGVINSAKATASLVEQDLSR